MDSQAFCSDDHHLHIFVVAKFAQNTGPAPWNDLYAFACSVLWDQHCLGSAGLPGQQAGLPEQPSGCCAQAANHTFPSSHAPCSITPSGLRPPGERSSAAWLPRAPQRPARHQPGLPKICRSAACCHRACLWVCQHLAGILLISWRERQLLCSLLPCSSAYMPVRADKHEIKSTISIASERIFRPGVQSVKCSAPTGDD